MSDTAESGSTTVVPTDTWKYVAMGIAGLMGLVVVAFLVYLCIRKCRRRGAPSSEDTIDPTDTMHNIMQKNKVGSVSRYGRKQDGAISAMPVGKGKNKQQPDYFMDLAAKIKVKSISDYKK